MMMMMMITLIINQGHNHFDVHHLIINQAENA